MDENTADLKVFAAALSGGSGGQRRDGTNGTLSFKKAFVGRYKYKV